MEREAAPICCSWIPQQLFSLRFLLPISPRPPNPELPLVKGSSHQASAAFWPQWNRVKGMCGFGFAFISKAVRMTSVWLGGVSAQSGEFLQNAGIHLCARSAFCRFKESFCFFFFLFFPDRTKGGKYLYIIIWYFCPHIIGKLCRQHFNRLFVLLSFLVSKPAQSEDSALPCFVSFSFFTWEGLSFIQS